MLPFKDFSYIDDLSKEGEYVFVADVGGTNSNFALCLIIHNQVSLIYSLHIKSHYITEFASVAKEVLDHIEKKFSLSVARACLGVAGVVSEDGNFVQPTNLPFFVDSDAIKKVTSLQWISIINDFLAVGYGLDFIDQKDIIEIHQAPCPPYAQKGIIGAGTGLGKTLLYWNEKFKQYIPLPSEGGHADFPAQYHEELKLVEYVREKHKRIGSISWEHFLSGHGISCIYSFLSETRSYEKNEIDEEILANDLHPDQIFAFKNQSKICDETVELFTRFYARCAKDYALNGLTFAGLYIAGGIASKNIGMFSRQIFMDEFLNNTKKRKLLECIPIYVIADYNISLYGTAAYLLIHR